MVEKLAALKKGNSFDFWGTDKPICPHCGDEFDISKNEAWELYDENDRHTVECLSCETEFTVISSASWTFSTDEQKEE